MKECHIGKYLVTGNRNVVAMLTIHAANADGAQQWELDSGVTLYDVTHLACRSARYPPTTGDESSTPVMAKQATFPVISGAEMLPIDGYQKQD